MARRCDGPHPAGDIMLCDEAYFNSCTWNYNVPTGECINTGASAGWNGFHNDAVSSSIPFSLDVLLHA